jgi:hypothetical protein
MYGLPQAGRVANDALVKQLAVLTTTQLDSPTDYSSTLPTPSCSPLSLMTLAYSTPISRRCSPHRRAFAPLQIHHRLGRRTYCIHLKWDYVAGTVDLSMPGYVKKALLRFTHPNPNKPCPQQMDRAQLWCQTTYSSTTPAQPFQTPRLSRRYTPFFTAVPSISPCRTWHHRRSQAEATELTMDAVTFLLNYCATHPDAVLRYRRSGMILHVDSDASYLSERRPDRALEDFSFWMTRKPLEAICLHNGAIHVERYCATLCLPPPNRTASSTTAKSHVAFAPH